MMHLIEITTRSALWVDDERPLPPNNNHIVWDLARTYDEAIEKISNIHYDIISLDHDLGCFNKDGREMTGYDIALFLAELKHNGKSIPYVTCHSANPAGRKNIESVIGRYLND